MSGVRFVSIISAMVASFLWGNLVFDAWQKNQSNRAMAQLEAAASPDVAGPDEDVDGRELTVQQRADELAAAASAEFSKLTQGIGDEPGVGLIAASEEKSKTVDEGASVVPAPILKANADAIVEAVKDSAIVQDKAAVAKAEAAVREAVETSQKVAALESSDKVLAEKTAAEMTAETLVKTVEKVSKPERWSVPTGATPVYDESRAIRVGEAPWRVPTGADPYYPPVVQHKIGKIADRVSDKAADATKNVGAKLSSIANDVKSTIATNERWRVPDGNTPVYPDQAQLADSQTAWEVPTGVTPEYGEDVDDKIGVATLHHGRGDKLAVSGDVAFAKDQRQLSYDSSGSDGHNDADAGEPIEVVGKIVARLADELDAPAATETAFIEKDDARLSKDRVTVPVDKYAWKVPDAADPIYSVRKTERRGEASEVQLAAGPSLKQDFLSVAKHGAAEKSANDAADEGFLKGDKALNMAEERVGPVGDLTKNVADDAAKADETTQIAALRNPKEEIEGGFEKSGSQLRLSDEVADDTENKTKAAPRRVAVWSVPDGATPEYGVAEKIERGLDSVKAAAADAGDEIASKVSALNDKVKDAVTSSDKWEIPTGVTWGDDEKSAGETQLAELAGENKPGDEDDTQPELAAVESDAIEGDGKMRDVAIDGSATEEGPEMFVSAQMAPVGEAPATSEDRADVPVKVASRGEGDGLSVVKSLKRVFSMLTQDEADNGDVNQPASASRVDEVRFDALKTLMVDDVAYNALDAKKGHGQLKVAGRSQPGVRLSLYVDLQYLGDVDADQEGEWSIDKELYLTQGQHLIRAEQMTDGGLMLARKTQPFAQAVAMKQPEGHENKSVGIGLGDKALAVMRNKLKADDAQNTAFNSAGGLPKNPLMSPALAGLGDAGAKNNVKTPTRVVQDLPLPVLKPADLRLAESKGQHRLTDKVGVQHVAMVGAQADVARDGKEEKQAVVKSVEDKPVAEKAAVKVAEVTDTDAAKTPAADTEVSAGAADKNELAETKAAALVTSADENTEPADAENAEKGDPEQLEPINNAGEAVAKDKKTADAKAVKSVDTAADKIAVASGDARSDAEANAVDKAVTDGEPEKGLAEKLEVAALDPGDSAAVTPKNELASKGTKVDESGAEIAKAAKADGEDKAETLAREKSADESKIADAGVVATTYIVKRGDTLAGIAKSVYGDALRYKEILKLNPKLKSANLIYPKQKLIIRGDGEAAAVEDAPKPVEVAAVKDVTPPVAKKASEEKQAEKVTEATDTDADDQKEFYVVKAGDSLWKIAQQVYGSGGRFKEILELNPDLKKNPGLIRPKVKLRVRTAA